MSDTLLFVLIFGGLFVLRIIAATVVFFLLLPDDGRCPDCDEPTARVASPVFDRWLPWFRKCWCLRCGWEGVLRRGTPTTSDAPAPEHRVTHSR
jgi:hypothetical protein